jgi:hypothetical protein
MSPANVECPHCDAVIDVSEVAPGALTVCENCNQQLTVPDSMTNSQGPPPLPPPLPPPTEISDDRPAIVHRHLDNAKFGLAELSHSIPPPLPLEVDPKGECDEEVSSDEGSTESSDARFAIATGSDQIEEFSLDDGKGTVRDITGRSSAPRASKGSGVGPVIQVIFGGLLALPLAQLVCWYWPWGPQDPFKFGPELSSFAVVKWMVPAEFHNSADESTQ